MDRATILIRLLVACVTLSMTSCGTPAGEGRKAKAGYKAAAPVIAALEKFYAERGFYPAELTELVPIYLPPEALLANGRVQRRFGYGRYDDAYSLSFSYAGHGLNQFWYDSTTRSWSARGYY